MNQLIQKAIKGDSKSFESLIKSKKNNIYKVAYSFVNNENDALDIVQESVYKAYMSINKLKHPEYFNTWLTKIVINCSINFINKTKKVTYLDKDITESIAEEPQSIEEKMDLKEALSKLDAKYKIVIILKYFEGLTLNEIADVLGIPLNTVKTRSRRAIERLKIELKEEEVIE